MKFTIIQLCINIDQEYLDDLFDDLKEYLRQFEEDQNSSLLIDLLDILRQFLEKMTVDIIFSAKSIVIQSLDMISYRGPNSQELYEKLGDFLGVC